MILLAENPKEYINIQISIAALFLTAKNWKQSKYPSTGEWINKSGISIQWNITWSLKRNGGTDTC